MKVKTKLVSILIMIMLFALYPAKIFANSSHKAVRVEDLRANIQTHRINTWHLQDRVGITRRPTSHAERHTHSIAFLNWINRSWLHSQRQAAKAVASVPHLGLWLCIHSHEAQDWHNKDTGHNGHYGGLQMSYNWGWNKYGVHWGLKGYAYKYSELQQMQAAERGYRANGYSQSWLLGQWYHPDCV